MPRPPAPEPSGLPPYVVRRSARARRVSVRVTAETGVEVVMPTRARESAARAAVIELRPWIERRLCEMRRIRQEIDRRAVSNTLPYLGRELIVVAQKDRERVRLDGDRLLVPTGAGGAQAIERFYRRSARIEIGRRLDRATASVGLSYRDLAIRGQRTRWASCSHAGAMSFNWRLLLAPERVLWYVVWHEVCHLEIRDHSARFWALVESRWPRYRDDRRWLKANGPTLVLAG